MTKDTAEKIARNTTTGEVQKWSSGVAAFGSETYSPILKAASRTCGVCPFRENVSMGGCIGEECPVNAVRKALNLTMKRVATAVKEIYKAKYRIGK